MTPYRANIEALLDRQEAKGIKKYGLPLEDNNKDILKRLQDIQEELIDALFYLEHLKDKIVKARCRCGNL
jgi:hypothetical protein